MSKLKIAIAANDEEYAKKLAEYIPHHYSPEAEAEMWSAGESGRRLEPGGRDADILLAEENRVELLPTAASLVITLSEHKRPADSRTLYKYQCADALLNQVLRIYARECPGQAPLVLFNRKTRIIALFSAGGGEGKTTLAVALSIQAAWQGRSAFYLNLENTPSVPLYFAGEQENSLSNALYALKHHGQVREKVESAICTDPAYRIDFFRQPDSLLDLQEDQGGDLAELVRLLAETGRYDRLFIDLSGGVTRSCLALLEACDDILLVCTPGQPAGLKARRLLQEMAKLDKSWGLGLLGKVRLVLNKTEKGGRDNASAEEALHEGIKITARIPWAADLEVLCRERIRPALDGPFGEAVHQLGMLWED